MIEKHRLVDTTILAMLLIVSCGRAELHLEFPGPEPGPAQDRISRSALILENKVIACTWGIYDGRLKLKNAFNSFWITGGW